MKIVKVRTRRCERVLVRLLLSDTNWCREGILIERNRDCSTIDDSDWSPTASKLTLLSADSSSLHFLKVSLSPMGFAYVGKMNVLEWLRQLHIARILGAAQSDWSSWTNSVQVLGAIHAK